MEEKKGPDAASIARDAKCAPIARKALALCLAQKASLADVPLAADIKAVTEAIIAELALTNATVLEVNWVSKLMVQAIGNGAVSIWQTEGLESGDERYHAAAYALLKVLVDEEVTLGMYTPEELKEKYASVGAKIVATVKELGLNAVEADYVFGLLSAMATNIGKNVTNSVEVAKEKTAEKLFGVESLNDVTIARIVEIQQA